MIDAKRLLDQFLGSQVPGTGTTVKGTAGQVQQMAKDNPLAAGAIAGLLLGTKSGRKLGGSALKLGGLAVVAGLGYQAYRNYQAGKTPETPTSGGVEPDILPPPEGTGFDANPANADDDFVLSLIRVMIAAARADGHIDANERGRIIDKLHVSGLEAESGTFIEQELSEPSDLDAIVNAARSDEQRIELYTAARLAIEPDSRAERGFLDLLAGRLNLPDALVDHIEATVSAAKVSTPV